MKSLLQPMFLAVAIAGCGLPAQAHLDPAPSLALPESNRVEKAVRAEIPAYYRKRGTAMVHSRNGNCWETPYDPATCDGFRNAGDALKKGGQMCRRCNSSDM